MSRAREFADLAGSADAGGLTGRNMIINGAMQVHQRGGTATMNNNQSYSLDRFQGFASAGGTYTITQDSDTPSGEGFINSLKVAVTSADSSLASGDYYVIDQRIEGNVLAQAGFGTSGAKAVTLSFFVRSSVTGSHGGSLSNNATNRSYPYTYTVSSANTWENHTLTFPADTTGAFADDNGVGLGIHWYMGAGSNISSGTLGTTWHTTQANRAAGQVNLADSTDNEWYITGVQLEVGSQATPFEHRSLGEELQLCKRYFHKTGGTAYCNVATVTNFTSGAMLGPFNHPVEMRSAPSVTKSGNWAVLGGDTTVNQTAVSSDSNGKVSEIGFQSGSGGTSGRSATLRFNNDADAYLHWDAEL